MISKQMERQMSLFERPAFKSWDFKIAERELKTPNPLEPKFFGSNYVPKEDDTRLTGGIKRIFSLMQDGNWRTLQEIERLTKVPAASVSANLRHLKREAYGSHGLEKKIRGERSGGLWEYKLIVNK